jgi:predicted XRE-type DNA-binding protein
MKRDDEVFHGSGYVFADLGIENPEEHKLKVQISLIIERLVDERGLSQREAALIMGLKQADVSNIVRGVLSGFSLDRLLRCLRALDQDVTITIRPAEGHPGRLGVAYG